jgi:diguanylate cyclase (GGDEF)-like protein
VRFNVRASGVSFSDRVVWLLTAQAKKQTWKQSIILIDSILIVIFIAYLDSITREEISFYIYYAIPIALSSWFVSQRAGIITAVASALAWYMVDVRDHLDHSALHYWNICVRLTFFIAMSLILTKLRFALEREKDLASKDSLTGLSNRRAFFEIADLEIKRARRYGRALTIAYMDLDRFKDVNDRKGHEEGDRLLQSVADSLRRCTRGTDAVARIGGDEFVVLLPETGEEAAFTAVQKIHQEILQIMREHQWPVTLSVGALTFNEPPETVDEMLRNADHLMYSAKKGGKNSIRFQRFDPKAGEDLPIPTVPPSASSEKIL